MTSEIRRRRLTATAIVLGAVIVLVLLIAMRPRAQRLRPPAVVPLVTVETVASAQPPVTVVAWGTVRPRDSVNLTPQVGGLVVAISPHLRAGGFFAAGETLVQIETTDYELVVQQARSQVAQAEVALALAREEAETARLEWERTGRSVAGIDGGDGSRGATAGAALPSPLVLREPQLRQAEAQLAAAKAALTRAEVDLRRCRIVAPFAGRVLSASVAAGQVVRAGEVLASVHDTATAEITVHVPDRDLAWIAVPLTADDPREGTAATVHADFAGGRFEWSGRVARLGGSVSESSRQVPIVVEVAEPYRVGPRHRPLMSGMFVGVTFASPPPPGSVTITRRALRPGDQVWLLDGEDRLSIRTVEVARTDAQTAVIASGLAPGDRLITSNLQYVIDGMQLAPSAGDGAEPKGGRP